MPKLNADEKVFDPIEITLGGKTYVITEITQDMFDELQRIAKENQGGTDAVLQQLAVFLGANLEDLRKIDLRRAGAVLRFLTETVTAQAEGKSGNA